MSILQKIPIAVQVGIDVNICMMHQLWTGLEPAIWTKWDIKCKNYMALVAAMVQCARQISLDWSLDRKCLSLVNFFISRGGGITSWCSAESEGQSRSRIHERDSNSGRVELTSSFLCMMTHKAEYIARVVPSLYHTPWPWERMNNIWPLTDVWSREPGIFVDIKAWS